MKLKQAGRWTVVVIALAFLWSVMTGGDGSSWWLGIPTLLFAAWVATRLGLGFGIQPLGLVRFVPLFLWESLVGGIDVTRRTLNPALRLAPGYVRYRTDLAGELERILFVNCVNLLPGTLVVDLKQDQLEVHLLDKGCDPAPNLRRLERAVAALELNDWRDRHA